MYEIHEPQLAKDAKNAGAYYLIVAVMTCGLALVVGGMVSPIFLPKIYRRIDADGLGDRFDKVLATIGILIWFFASWALMIYFNLHPPG